ncbi:MAG: hypothetical protein ACRCWQ_06895 [Bacilli bacterium]
MNRIIALLILMVAAYVAHSTPRKNLTVIIGNTYIVFVSLCAAVWWWCL